jgi:hypothetical protein
MELDEKAREDLRQINYKAPISGEVLGKTIDRITGG